MIDPNKWPRLPSSQPARALYVNEVEEPDTVADMSEKGWEILDVRVMPCTNMVERQRIVLAWLEGIRSQTIVPHAKMLDFLDLEAQITGLKTGKQQVEDKKVDKGTLASLLDFKNHRVRENDVAQKAPKK